MVQRVEKLCAELCRHLFMNWELLGEVEIQIYQSRTPQNSNARVADDPIRRESHGPRRIAERHECAGIKPPVHATLVVRQSAVRNAIRPEPALAADVHDLARVDGER